jgi:hypothetical protein
MKYAIVLGLTLVFGFIPATAQTAPPLKSQPNLFLDFPAVSTCPIGMRARQGISGQLAAVQNGQRKQMLVARLYLTLTGPDSADSDAGSVNLPPTRNSQIRSATVTVHGWNGKDRILPVSSDRNPSAEASKTLTVRFDPTEDRDVTTDLLLPGFTATSMVDLDSVTYADGSTWKFAGQRACHVAPDGLMLVSGR